MAAATEQPVVLITGHNGFSGRHLLDYLSRMTPPPRIIGLDLVASDALPADRQRVGDLTALGPLRTLLAECRPNLVLHLAGCMPPAPATDMWAVNVGGTFSLLEALRWENLSPRVVVIGSAAECGVQADLPIRERAVCRPTTDYGRTKLAQTLLCQRYVADFGLPIMIARPFNLFGPGMGPQTVIGELCGQIAREPADRRIRLGNLASARDFIDIRDAVAAYWAIARHGAPGEVYNVCRGEAVKIQDMVDVLLGTLDEPYRVVSESSRLQKGDIDTSWGDPSKLAGLPDVPPPRGLRESLCDTLAWFRAQRQHP